MHQLPGPALAGKYIGHLALRGTTWHYVAQEAPYMYAYMRVGVSDLTARAGLPEIPDREGEFLSESFEGPLGSPRRAIQPSSREKTAVRAASGERAARARLPITVICRREEPADGCQLGFVQ